MGSCDGEIRGELLRREFHRRVSLARNPTWKVARSGHPTTVAVRYHEPKEMSPMTVRWKPLLILSGVFLIIAVVGVVAITWTLVPRNSADILPMARAARNAGQYEKAKIHYLRALQKDSKNATIHEEMAGMFAEWSERAPSDKKAEIQGWQISSLINAAKFDRKAKEPRRQLLADAMRRDVAPDAIYWAKELLGLEPNNTDAHYVLAAEGLEERSPNRSEIQRHLTALTAAKAPMVRIAWLKARFAQAFNDETAPKRLWRRLAASPCRPTPIKLIIRRWCGSGRSTCRRRLISRRWPVASRRSR